VNQHLEPLPAPAGVPDATEASRIERLLLLLLEHLGVTPEAVQEAWRGEQQRELNVLSEHGVNQPPPARPITAALRRCSAQPQPLKRLPPEASIHIKIPIKAEDLLYIQAI
jgi:hypothetical protein